MGYPLGLVKVACDKWIGIPVGIQICIFSQLLDSIYVRTFADVQSYTRAGQSDGDAQSI